MKIKLRKIHELLFVAITTICINCGPVDDYENLGHGCLYYGGDGDGIRVPSQYGRSIFGKVLEYRFDNDYILVKQKPDKQDYIMQISTEIRAAQRNMSTKEERRQLFIFDQKADSIIKNDPYFVKVFSSRINYWIINHHSKSITGPMSKQEFTKKFRALRIDDTLMLNLN
jgi:hypothetical protein